MFVFFAVFVSGVLCSCPVSPFTQYTPSLDLDLDSLDGALKQVFAQLEVASAMWSILRFLMELLWDRKLWLLELLALQIRQTKHRRLRILSTESGLSPKSLPTTQRDKL
jgi:hypothetical protein